MAAKFPTGIDLQSQKATGAADATANSDVPNWLQVQNLVQAVTRAFHAEARATGNVDISTLNAGDTLDGVTLAAGDVVLLDQQTTAAQDGLYVVASSEGGTVRHAQLPSGASGEGILVTVSAGSTHGGKTFRGGGTDVVVGTDGLAFVEMAGGTTYTAGDGLTESPAGTFNVNPGTNIEVVSDAVRIAATAAGAGLTGGGASALAVGAGTGITVNANDVAADTSVIARWFTFLGPGSSSTTVTLTHNLGKLSYVTNVILESTGEVIYPDIVQSANSVTATFGTAQSSNSIRINVIG